MFVERRSSYWKEGAQSRELFIEVSVNYNFILSKSFIRKRKLQHYPHEPKVNICLSFVKLVVDNQAYHTPTMHFTHMHWNACL